MRRIHHQRLHKHALPEEAWHKLRSHPKASRLLIGSWLIVIAVIFLTMVLDGTSFSFGIFFKSMEADLNLSRSAVSAIYSVNMAVAAAFGMAAGLLLDKWGASKIMLLMAVFTGSGLILTGYVQSPWQIFITYGLLLGIGGGPTYIVTNSIVMRTMKKRQGLVVGLVNSGEGLGIMMMAPLATLLIANLGWQMAYVVIGIIAIVTIIPVALLVRKTPQENIAHEHEIVSSEQKSKEDAQGELSIGQMIKSRSFWLFAGGGLALGSTVALLFTHIVPHATDVGLTPNQAALIMTLIGIASISGAMIIGIICDKIGHKPAAVISCLLLTGAISILLFSESMWALYIFAIVGGFAYMGSLTSLTALVGATFGLANVGKVLGVLSISFGLAAFLGPLMGGIIYDNQGSYTIAFTAAAVTVLVAAFLITQIRRVDKGVIAK
jgi:MFS family permease